MSLWMDSIKRSNSNLVRTEDSALIYGASGSEELIKQFENDIYTIKIYALPCGYPRIIIQAFQGLSAFSGQDIIRIPDSYNCNAKEIQRHSIATIVQYQYDYDSETDYTPINKSGKKYSLAEIENDAIAIVKFITDKERKLTDLFD